MRDDGADAQGDDRLGWIFGSGDRAQLRANYDAWAAEYDADHAGWGWRGPALLVEEWERHRGADGDVVPPSDGYIVDAGCGTGAVGVVLDRSDVVGLDLSAGMLDVAGRSGAYAALAQCSLDAIPLADGAASAVLSAGVFTHGHVGGEAFAELCRVTCAGGLVVLTQRVDVIDTYRPFADALVAEGRWEVVAMTEPQRFHPGKDDTEQVVLTYRVLE